MSKKSIHFVLLAVLAAALAGCATMGETKKEAAHILPPYKPTGDEPVVAVVDFDNESFFESDTLGPQVTRMFETALVKSHRFKVVDRKKLEHVMREKNMAKSGDVQANAASFGKVLGVEYLITGSVTEFGIKREGSSVGFGASTADSTAGAGVTTGSARGTARIVVDLKVIAVKDGTIAYSDSAVGESYSENVNFGLDLLTGGTKLDLNANGGTIGFDETVSGKAARACADEHVYKMVSEDGLGGGAAAQ